MKDILNEKGKKIRRILLLKIDQELKSGINKNIMINSQNICELNKSYNSYKILLSVYTEVYSNYVEFFETNSFPNRKKQIKLPKHDSPNKKLKLEQTAQSLNSSFDSNSPVPDFIPNKIDLGHKKFTKRTAIILIKETPKFFEEADNQQNKTKDDEKTKSTKVNKGINKVINKNNIKKINSEDEDDDNRTKFMKKLRKYCYKLIKRKKRIKANSILNMALVKYHESRDKVDEEDKEEEKSKEEEQEEVEEKDKQKEKKITLKEKPKTILKKKKVKEEEIKVDQEPEEEEKTKLTTKNICQKVTIKNEKEKEEDSEDSQKVEYNIDQIEESPPTIIKSKKKGNVKPSTTSSNPKPKVNVATKTKKEVMWNDKWWEQSYNNILKDIKPAHNEKHKEGEKIKEWFNRFDEKLKPQRDKHIQMELIKSEILDNQRILSEYKMDEQNKVRKKIKKGNVSLSKDIDLTEIAKIANLVMQFHLMEVNVSLFQIVTL